MGNKRMGIVQRALSLLLAAAIVYTLTGASLSGFTDGALTVRAASDVFELYSESSVKQETVTLDEGDFVDTQFNTNEALCAVEIEVSGDSNNKTITAALYRWDRNGEQSAQGTPIATREITGWSSGDSIGIDFVEAGVGEVAAGEYMFRLTMTKGSVDVTMKLPAAMGIRSYVNSYFLYGGLLGRIRVAAETNSPYELTSTPTDITYHTAPPEYVYEDDSAVIQMGVDPSQWVAVDDLGRTLPDYGDVGEKKDKDVGIFYWTWHYNFSSYPPININNLMIEHPELQGNYHHPLWAEYSAGSYFWNEPLYGYYSGIDRYVLRKHAELLADAGVDFVLFDCTNGNYTWEPAYMRLLQVWSEAREQGIDTPQIAFMMQFSYTDGTHSSLTQVYDAIYKEGKYQDLWYYVDGKPLIMAYNSGLDENVGLDQEIKNFFSFRAGVASYFDNDRMNDHWGWLHVYPQALYKREDGSVEMTTVGVAMNANYKEMVCSAMNGPYNMGRSYTAQENFSYSYEYRGNNITVDKNIENATYYGLNFQEQWDYAIAQDPDIIFVTGWNEWIMGRFESWGGVDNAFPDQYNDENSRDVEPSRGDLKDYYYYQLVANIRRFKGVSMPTAQTQTKTIDITAGAEQWNDENIITYNHYTQNTYERHTNGFKGTRYIVEPTRNDIKTAKVSYDNDNIYFYVETVDDLTPYTDSNWMRLLLDTQAATADSTDYEEFEYILNRNSPTADEMTLERSLGGWSFETVGTVSYTVSGNILQVAVPRSMLGMDGDEVTFNFKWCDNNLTDGDILTLYETGDAAPGGRFAFAFSSEPYKAESDVDVLLIVVLAVTVVLVAAAVVVVIMTRKKKTDDAKA